MRYHLIGRAHDPGPSVSVIADGMQAEGTERNSSCLILPHGNRGPATTKQVGHLTALAQLSKVTGELVKLERRVGNQGGELLLGLLLGLDRPDYSRIQGSYGEREPTASDGLPECPLCDATPLDFHEEPWWREDLMDQTVVRGRLVNAWIVEPIRAISGQPKELPPKSFEGN